MSSLWDSQLQTYIAYDQKLLLESGKIAWNIKSFVNMMELGFYMASICFATQIMSINPLNKRTLFAKLKKKTLTYIQLIGIPSKSNISGSIVSESTPFGCYVGPVHITLFL